MAPNPRDQKWYSIAEQASKETDPEKLNVLVSQLCGALDERLNPPASQPSTPSLFVNNALLGHYLLS